MIHLQKRETKLMVAVHGWSGIVLGLLLYAIVFTGMAAVFAQEIGAWSAGHVERQAAFGRPIDATVRDLAARTPAKYMEGVDLFETGDRDLGIFFHRHETDPAGEVISRGVFYRVDAAGRVVQATPGTNEEVFGPRNDSALSAFLVDTHVRLHLPNPWGLLLTGIVGLAMLVAAISGLLIHRHLFKDIFTLRRAASPVLVERDRHSVAGTWSLPFAFLLAFTGSFFSFFGTVGAPIVAVAAFGGDVQALTESVYGTQAKPDPRPAAAGDLDRVMADAAVRVGDVPTFVAIENYRRADSRIVSYHLPRAGDVEPPTLVYHGATGGFDRVRPAAGTRASVGGSLAGIMAPLHFGNFAGLLSKAVWFSLGFAMCFVTLTGLRLWLVRRQEGARSLAWLDRLTTVVGLGLPFALVMCAGAFLIAMPGGQATWWTPAAFLAAAAVVMVAAVVAPSRRMLDRMLLAGTGVGMVLLPPLRLLCGGPGWSVAIGAGQPVIAAVDAAFILGGGWTLWHLRQQRGASDAVRHPVLQAAE
jgi:uncharacterized iron-regulated membrane protein